MNFTQPIPWNKYGLIVELSKRLQYISPQFGKTAMQKMVYLLSEVFGVPCGYEYTLYTYGPYSADLAADVEYVAAMDGVVLQGGPKGGYRILPSEKSSLLTEKSVAFIQKYSTKIDQLVSHFGSFSARELELRSTLIFLQRNGINNESQLAEKLIELKPYFSYEEVLEAIHDMNDAGFLVLN